VSRINQPPADHTGDIPREAMPVELSVEDGVATVTLNRPEKRNAVTFAMWAALADTVGSLANDPDARVLVVRGATTTSVPVQTSPSSRTARAGSTRA